MTKESLNVTDDSEDNHVIDLDQLFQPPQIAVQHELERVSRDARGKPRKLTPDNLRQIADFATLTIPSSYPGNDHVWEINPWLLSGRKNFSKIKNKTIDTAIEHIITRVPHRISGDLLSLKSGWTALKKGCNDIFLEAIGKKYAELNGVNQIIDDKRKREIEKRLKKTEKDGVFERTSEKQLIDFRLYGWLKDETVITILEDIQERADVTWIRMRFNFQKNLYDAMLSEEYPMDYVIQEIEDKSAKQQEEILFQSILEMSYLRAISIVNELLEEANRLESHQIERIEHELESAAALRSRVEEWKKKETLKKIEGWREGHKFNINEVLLSKLQEAPDLKQWAYFVSSSLKFKEKGETFRNNISHLTVPKEKDSIEKVIWFKRNWPIMKKNVDGQVKYYAETTQKVEFSSARMGWKIGRFWKEFRANCKNLAYRQVHYRMLHGPFSVRALLSPWSYVPLWHVNENTGALEPLTDEKYQVESYLASLWARVQAIRNVLAEWQKQPDEGFVGKRVNAVPFYLWHVGVKGCLLIPLRIVAFPIACALNVFLSSVSLLFLPFWVFARVFAKYLFETCIYRAPGYKRELWFPIFNHLFNVAVLGVGQIAVAFIGAAAYHPLMALYWILHAYSMNLFRMARDATFYRLLIAPFGRLPSANSFLIRRKQGPGIGLNYCFTIKPDLACLILQVYLENVEMGEFLHDLRTLILAPELQLLHFHKQVFSHFGSVTDWQHPIMQKVQSRNAEIDAELEGLVANLHHISQKSEDQAETIRKARYVISKWFPRHVFKYMTAKFWDKHKLSMGDWNGLTRVILGELFGDNFFAQPADQAKALNLEVSHPRAAGYALTLWRPLFHDADRQQMKLDRSPFEKLKPKFVYPKVTIHSALAPPKIIQGSFQVWEYGKNLYRSADIEMEE